MNKYDPYSYLWETYLTAPKPQPKAHVKVFRSLNCWNYEVKISNPPEGMSSVRYTSHVTHITPQGAETSARRTAANMLREAKRLIDAPIEFTLTLDDVA
jgi:hypothetical protein